MVLARLAHGNGRSSESPGVGKLAISFRLSLPQHTNVVDARALPHSLGIF
jgi:hypothetical protein